MIPAMGAYRESIDVESRFVVPVPPGLGDETAALLPLNYLTAYAMIERCARLQSGQSFLIHGAAGGVGSAALELARLLGLRAYGSASAPKRDLVASLGGIPLHREDDRWKEELERLESGGVDAAFDAFGIASFRRSWRSLSPEAAWSATASRRASTEGTSTSPWDFSTSPRGASWGEEDACAPAVRPPSSEAIPIGTGLRCRRSWTGRVEER